MEMREVAQKSQRDWEMILEQEKREKSIQRQWSVWRQIENENERSSAKESERKKYSETGWYEDRWKKIGKKFFKKKKNNLISKNFHKKNFLKSFEWIFKKISRNKFETIVKKNHLKKKFQKRIFMKEFHKIFQNNF